MLSVQETRHVPGRRVHACLSWVTGRGGGGCAGIDLPKCAPSGLWDLELGHPAVSQEERTGGKKKKRRGSQTQELEKSFFPLLL